MDCSLSELGLSVVPINPRTKRPPTSSDKEFPHGISWSRLQKERASESDLSEWRQKYQSAWTGIVCGVASGNLEVIDFDVPEKSVWQSEPPAFEPWKTLLIDNGFGDLFSKLLIVNTPSGGKHIYYRCASIEGNQKLAVDPLRRVLIETRGDGGLVVSPPSPDYEIEQGKLDSIPVLSLDERSTLLFFARLLDESAPLPDAVETSARSSLNGTLRPGDLFEQHATWDEVMVGCQKSGVWQQRQLWTRPGKKISDGCSAVSGPMRDGADRLLVYSSNFAPFEMGRCYTKFGAWTLLVHGGDFRASAKAAKKWCETRGYKVLAPAIQKDLDRPVIAVNSRTTDAIGDEAYGALVAQNSPPTLFVRGGELVRIIRTELGVCRIQTLTLSALIGVLSKAARFVRDSKDGRSDALVPKTVAEYILGLGQWPEIPAITNITSAPCASVSGVVDWEPGYSPQSLIFGDFAPNWARWSSGNAAGFLVNEVLGDFPFATNADLANALGLMLLPLVRPMIAGPTPLHVIDAPVQGTGKTLLGKVCLIPAVGSHIALTGGTRDEEEWRKKIASLLLEGQPYIFLDNLSRKVDSDTLAGSLTSTIWKDRALGSLSTIGVPIRCAWVATANNVELSRDLVRRSVWIRLDAGVERPEERAGFAHPNIEKWVLQNRQKIVAALLSLIESWVAAGRPEFSGQLLGSFEEYREVVGGILAHAGVSNWLGNVAELRASATADDAAWGAFYGRWWEQFEGQSVQAKELFELFCEDEILVNLLGDRTEKGQKTRFGMQLKKRCGVICNGYRVKGEGTYQRAFILKLEQVGLPTEKGSPRFTGSNGEPLEKGSQVQDALFGEPGEPFSVTTHREKSSEAVDTRTIEIADRGSPGSPTENLTPIDLWGDSELPEQIVGGQQPPKPEPGAWD